MPAKSEPYENDVRARLGEALASGEAGPLEGYLTERSGLPGPRMNLALVEVFARAVGDVVGQPEPPVGALERLLDGWAALPLADAPVNDPREMLPATAVRTYGQVAVARPDWWDDEIAKLHLAAGDPRWRVREMVATALQRMLAADWSRTYRALAGWLSGPEPLVVRAAAAAVAEPPLLHDGERGAQAVAIQAGATAWLERLPTAGRQDEAVRVLRQALGYTVSVAAAAAPALGLALLEKLALSGDADLHWIVRENLKKHRLQPWAAQLAAIQGHLVTVRGHQ